MCRPRKSLWFDRGCRLIALSFPLIAAGCTSTAAGVGQVSGTVRLNGRDLKSDESITWTVHFVTGDGTRFTDSVGRNGRYTIDGVPAGPVKIAVTGRPRVPPGLGTPGEPPPRLDPVSQGLLKRLEKYQDPNRSGLSYTVANGPQEYDIPLNE